MQSRKKHIVLLLLLLLIAVVSMKMMVNQNHREKDKDYRDPAGRWSERSAWSVRRNS